MGQPPRRVFFYLGDPPAGAVSYPHCAITLAEGLRAHGWTIGSDRPAWQESLDGESLFPGDGVPGDCDLIVVSEDWFIQGAQSLPERPAGRTCPIVYVDRSDLTPTTHLIYSDELRKADLILRCHASTYFRYPANVRPWVFGLSERITEICGRTGSGNRRGAIWNFRAKQYPHTVRSWAERRIRPVMQRCLEISTEIDAEDEVQSAPYDELMRRQTAGRHSRSYYDRLGRTLVCACFGGWFILPVEQEEAGLLCRASRFLFRQIPVPTPAIAQWDSWRLWEAFASGALVLNVNFEQRGFQMPGPLPQAMVHYVSVDAADTGGQLDAILRDTGAIRTIAEAGRNWAVSHYSSTALAGRLLAELGI